VPSTEVPRPSQAILPFRHANKHWLADVWHGGHVESVDIVMKETEDCEGRTKFYEVRFMMPLWRMSA
jgi:glucose-6-phosphate 1-dehydrogenase